MSSRNITATDIAIVPAPHVFGYTFCGADDVLIRAPSWTLTGEDMGAGFGNTLAGDPIALSAVLAVIACFRLGLFSVFRMAKDEYAARRRIADLEIRLNEAESALASEAHVCSSGKAATTCRSASWAPCMVRHACHETPRNWLDFRRWVERDSAGALVEALHDLRDDGNALQHRHPLIEQRIAGGRRANRRRLRHAEVQAAGGRAPQHRGAGP
jgi:hypothetical protein